MSTPFGFSPVLEWAILDGFIFSQNCYPFCIWRNSWMDLPLRVGEYFVLNFMVWDSFFPACYRGGPFHSRPSTLNWTCQSWFSVYSQDSPNWTWTNRLRRLSTLDQDRIHPVSNDKLPCIQVLVHFLQPFTSGVIIRYVPNTDIRFWKVLTLHYLQLRALIVEGANRSLQPVSTSVVCAGDLNPARS